MARRAWPLPARKNSLSLKPRRLPATAAAFFISTNVHQHRDRSSLTGEHPQGHIGQAILAALFFLAWGLDSFLLHYTTWLNQAVPLVVRIPLGLLILTLSSYLVIEGHKVVFHIQREKPMVFRESVFARVRHPIYLSELLFYLGLLSMSLSLAAALVLLATFFFLHSISRYEERLLLKRFGDEYQQYIRAVPMWIPRPQIH